MSLRYSYVFGLILALGLPAAAPDPDAKIDRGLITKLMNSDDGMAAMFVMFAERAPLAAAYRMPDWAARGRFVVQQLQSAANHAQAGVRGYLQAKGVDYTAYWVDNRVYIRQGTLALARELARRPEVAAIVAEIIYSVPAPQATAGTQSAGWNIALISADQVWSTYSNKGAGIVVANIDTGVQYTHPAVASQYRGNSGGVFDHSGNWHDPANVCGGAPCDNNGHGTHTMGTMVGDNGAGMQIGVAPGAKWIACKGCESSTCSGSSLVACAQWVLAPGGDAARRPHVVNNSWGSGPGEAWYQSYVQSWVAAGIFPAFSAGNDGPSCGTAGSPGDYPESFASGATDSADNAASFSGRGPSAFGGVKPDASAPGVAIYSSVPTNAYQYYSGTSMASPHTAGTVALLWAIRSGYIGNVTGTAALLGGNAVARTTGESCGGIAAGASPNNTYGRGRIDAKRTVDAGNAPVNQAPVVTITAPATAGQQFDCGTPVGFTATASDNEDGDLTAAVQWSGPGTPATPVGGAVTKTFSCSSELGSRTITARATDTAGVSGADTIVVNIVNPNGPPAAPSSLAADASGSSVNLAWTDNSANEQGFRIYRRSKTTKTWSAWSQVSQAPAGATTATESAVPAGNHQYYVTAYNASGESAPSNSVSARVK